MKKKIVICEKADHPKCPECEHNEPHESQECGTYLGCFDGEQTDEVVFKSVRCISVESKTGKKIISNLNYKKDKMKGYIEAGKIDRAIFSLARKYPPKENKTEWLKLTRTVKTTLDIIYQTVMVKS